MNQNAAAGLVAAVLGVFCVAIIIGLAIAIFFLLTLQKALSRCSRRNRTMEPALVWLDLIPLFSLFWAFFMALKIGESLKQEFADREIDDGSDYGKNIGIAWAATAAIGFIISWIFLAADLAQGQGFGAGQSSGIGNLLSVPFSIAAFVLWIIYWVKIAGYSRTLDEDDKRGDDRDDRDDRGRNRNRDDDDDYDDDPPRRPSRSSRPDDRIR